MDTRLMEYIIEISEEHSITRAAQKLFLTQSALNQQLQKLERELGMPLFVRTRSDWRLTPAGEVYVQAARQILNMKRDAYSRIQDMKDDGVRRLTIGLIPERGVNMFTSIYPQFHKTFPDVQIEPVECSVRTMQNMITCGELDLGLITLLEHQKDENTYVHMADEEIFLAVPSVHPLASLGSPSAEDAPETELVPFSQDPFILIFRRSTMFQLETSLFEAAGFSPRVLFSTSSNVSKYRMVQSGVGCALLPRIFTVPNPGIMYFRIKGRPSWEITMCYRKGAYLSNAGQELLRLCKEYWEENKTLGHFG
ncbi:MAG: LysR family transcriptional regulator [Eubacteriales bacterium]|nr:LysR family transcriptional regulator [Eubacteriales bacterium]